MHFGLSKPLPDRTSRDRFIVGGSEVMNAIDLDRDPISAREEIHLAGNGSEANREASIQLEATGGGRCRFE